MELLFTDLGLYEDLQAGPLGAEAVERLPGAGALHDGQGVTDGMKAIRSFDETGPFRSPTPLNSFMAVAKYFPRDDQLISAHHSYRGKYRVRQSKAPQICAGMSPDSVRMQKAIHSARLNLAVVQ